MKMAVVGAGIVGVSCASYLRRDGHAVVLVDRAGPGEGASKGNAGAVSPGSCIPMAMPGVLAKVPKWLNDPQGPLTIRPAYFLAALPWLMRFVLAANPRRVAGIADAILALHAQAFECYAPLLENAGAADLIRRSGTLVVYESAAAFASSRGEWEMRRERGVEFRVLDAAQIRDIEPALSARYVNGVLLPTHGYVVDPFRLVSALAGQFVKDGGEIRIADVRRLSPRPGAGIGIEIDGATLEADRVVIAAGAWSNQVLATLGVSLPLETQRGYHVTLSGPKVEPRLPVTAAEHKFYATPMLGGLRIAGTVEFAGLDAPPDYRRARRLLEQGRQMYPALDTAQFTEWMGHRPCLPDSLPAIGPLPQHSSVLVAFGHGHNGMTSGPVTGRLIADQIAGRQPFIEPFAYRPGRF